MLVNSLDQEFRQTQCEPLLYDVWGFGSEDLKGWGGLNQWLGAGVIWRLLTYCLLGSWPLRISQRLGSGGVDSPGKGLECLQMALWEKTLSPSTLLGSVAGPLQIKLTKDRITTEKPVKFINTCSTHTHGGNSVLSNSKGGLELEAYIASYQTTSYRETTGQRKGRLGLQGCKLWEGKTNGRKRAW